MTPAYPLKGMQKICKMLANKTLIKEFTDVSPNPNWLRSHIPELEKFRNITQRASERQQQQQQQQHTRNILNAKKHASRNQFFTKKI
jgi:hypothetical protein